MARKAPSTDECLVNGIRCLLGCIRIDDRSKRLQCAIDCISDLSDCLDQSRRVLQGIVKRFSQELNAARKREKRIMRR
jgi:hypothetical protein